LACKSEPYFGKALEGAGARAVAIVSPFYYKLCPESVYAYFREIALSSPIDVTLYNIPMFASPIDLPTIRRLAEFPRVIGIKDSSGDLAFMMRMIAAVRPHDALGRPVEGHHQADERALPRSGRPDQRRHTGRAGRGQPALGGDLRGHRGPPRLRVLLTGRGCRRTPDRAPLRPGTDGRRSAGSPLQDLLALGLVQAAPDAVRLTDADGVLETVLLHGTGRADLLGPVLPLDLVFFALGMRRREEDRGLRPSAGRPSLPRFAQRSRRHSPS
jgi:hypothetical protein